jgi:hypothetical protein
LPAATARTASVTAPAARLAARSVPWDIQVSSSSERTPSLGAKSASDWT